MNRKLSEKEVQKRLDKWGYKLLEYNGQYDVLCEKDGYWYHVGLPNIMKNGKASTFGISNKCLAHNYQVALEKRKSDAQYVSHKIVKRKNHHRVLVTLKCKCGKEFIKDGSQIAHGNINLCCPDCYKIHKSNIRKTKKQKIAKDFANAGYKIIEYPKDISSNSVYLIEDKDGYRGRLRYGKLKNGRRLAIFAPNNKDLRLYNLKNLFDSYDIRLEPVELVGERRVKIRREDGSTFICGYYEAFSSLCGDCVAFHITHSSYETRVAQFLEEQDIQYVDEYVINSCRDILPLPFDFWLKDYNILIEVDGEQHFKPIGRFGGQKGFECCKKHDNIKDEYCKQYNIPLLRIPYYDFRDDKYRNKILDFIQTVQE